MEYVAEDYQAGKAGECAVTLMEEWRGLGERQVSGRNKSVYGGETRELKGGAFYLLERANIYTNMKTTWKRLLTNQIASLV